MEIKSFLHEWFRSKTRHWHETKEQFGKRPFHQIDKLCEKKKTEKLHCQGRKTKNTRGERERAAETNPKTVRPVWISTAAYTL